MFRRTLFRLAAGLLLAAGPLAATASAAGITNAPAPFDKGGVRIALVTYLSAGDFFQSYQSGAIAQAKALDIDLRLFPGRQDAAAQRESVIQAINLGVDGIVIDHGLPEALKDVAAQALDAGIPVVAFDVDLGNPAIPQIDQNDRGLARLLVDQAIKENGTAFEAAYVYVPGFLPLDRRDEVWTQARAANPGIVEKARFGVVNDTTATATADQAKAAFRANPDISVVIAPYDEFARGAKLALQDLGLTDKVKIYSGDISTADIGEIVEPGSPWVATAATNPAVVGAVSIRAIALKIAKQPVPDHVVVEPALVTREALVAADVRSLEELGRKVPSFASSEAARADWIPTN